MGNCYQSIEIQAPIAKVWQTINHFHDMSWASNVVTQLVKVGDKAGHELGAKRVLNDVFHETLVKLDADNFSFSYRIDEGPGPVASTEVSNYIGSVKLSEIKNATLVEWSSEFESADDSQVSEFCNPIYRALLAALKQSLSQ